MHQARPSGLNRWRSVTGRFLRHCHGFTWIRGLGAVKTSVALAVCASATAAICGAASGGGGVTGCDTRRVGTATGRAHGRGVVHRRARVARRAVGTRTARSARVESNTAGGSADVARERLTLVRAHRVVAFLVAGAHWNSRCGCLCDALVNVRTALGGVAFVS